MYESVPILCQNALSKCDISKDINKFINNSLEPTV